MAFKILGRDGVNLTTAGSTSDNLSAEARKIINLVDPTSAQDAATYAWVNAQIAGASAGSALDGTFRIKNTTDNTKQVAFDASGITTGTTRTIIMPDSNVDLGLVATAIQTSQKGANNGVASLDSGGKIPVAQLPNTVMEYQGAWNASTNTPTLVDGTGRNGDVYRVSAAGTQNLGSGSFTYAIGDWVVYNGTIWQKSPASDAVTSVNGQQGIVVLTTSDIAEGTNLYYTSARFNTAFAAKSTTDLAEGSNLYFTTARVLATALTGYSVGSNTALASTDTILQAFQKIQGQINATNSAASALSSTVSSNSTAISNLQTLSGVAANATDLGTFTGSTIPANSTEKAALQALQTGLEGHENAPSGAHAASAISNTPSGNVTSTTVQAAINELQTHIDTNSSAITANSASISTLQGDSGHVFEAGLAGEAMAANTLWLVRRAKSGETSGSYYKALADSAINSRVVGFIMVGASGISSGGAVRVYKLGSASLGTSDTSFSGTDIDSPVFLSQSAAGKWDLAPSQTAGSWLKEVGFVATTGIIEFQVGLLVQA